MPKRSFLIFCLMFFAVSFGVTAMAALVPSIARHFGVLPRYAIKLTWLYMLPYGVVALFWGPLTRVVKIKTILLITSFGFFASALLFSLSPSIGQAFVFRFLMGCFACGFVPLALITVGKSVTAKKKTKYIGIFFGISYVSTFLSVFLSGLIDWRFIYFIPAAISLCVFILVVRHMEEFDFRGVGSKITYFQTIKNKKALRFFAIILLGSFFYHSLHQRLGIYLSEYFSLGQVSISMIFTVSTLFAIVCEFSGGFLGARWGTIRLIRWGFFLMSVFVFLVLFARRAYFIAFGAALWGAGWSLTHVGMSAHITHLPDKFLRDASSLNSAIRFSFGGLGAFFGGLLAVSLTGFRVLFVIVFISIFFLGFNLNKILKEGESYG
jgi:predicted MFS family arabinose efflux permease